MTDRDWSAIVESERLAADEEFSEEIADSQFSRSQWGLIMTVVEFEIEQPDDPERARLVGDTSKVESVLPQLEKVGQRPGAEPADSGGSDGIVNRVAERLGIVESDDERLTAADELVQAYAATLQARLEAEGKWEAARTAASD